MPQTPRYALQFIAPGEPMNTTRAQLEANAYATEAALTRVQAQVNQLTTILPAGQAYISLDTDGVPYVDPAGTVLHPVGIGVDTDGAAYVVLFENGI